MASGGVAVARKSTASQAADLRAGKIAAIKARTIADRKAASGKVLPMRPSVPTREVADDTEGEVIPLPSSRTTPQDEFIRNRQSSKIQEGIGYSSGGDFEAHASEAGIEDIDIDDAANEDLFYQQAELENQLLAQNTEDGRIARLKSRAKEMTNEHAQKQVRKYVNGLKKQLNKRITDVTAKGASAADEGEFLMVVDTAGVAVSAIQLAETIVAPMISEDVQAALPVPPLDLMNKDGTDIFSMDWFSFGGSLVQFGKWYALLIFLFMMAITIFLFLGYLCYDTTMCRVLYM